MNLLFQDWERIHKNAESVVNVNSSLHVRLIFLAKETFAPGDRLCVQLCTSRDGPCRIELRDDSVCAEIELLQFKAVKLFSPFFEVGPFVQLFRKQILNLLFHAIPFLFLRDNISKVRNLSLYRLLALILAMLREASELSAHLLQL